jgi:long-subunit acyl-CoA synthetase (AMP-forming)
MISVARISFDAVFQNISTCYISNGENIEPNPIEDALLGCKLVDQVVLRGQDEKQLRAIVVLNPRELANEGYVDKVKGEWLQASYTSNS